VILLTTKNKKNKMREANMDTIIIAVGWWINKVVSPNIAPLIYHC
jgi:hypothetical protein